MLRIKSLEMNNGIVEMYVAQMSECYRSVLNDIVNAGNVSATALAIMVNHRETTPGPPVNSSASSSNLNVQDVPDAKEISVCSRKKKFHADNYLSDSHYIHFFEYFYQEVQFFKNIFNFYFSNLIIFLILSNLL